MTITTEMINRFTMQLREEEREPSTIEKYLRDVNKFAMWLGVDPLTHENGVRYKEKLVADGLKPATINGVLSTLNKLFECIRRPDCRIKKLRVQRRVFRSEEKELSKKEYQKLVETAYSAGKERIGLLMETICATGIRVSEVKAITVEAVARGVAQVCLKGKVRMILIPGKLRRKLKKYIKKQRITAGEIFLTKRGNSLSRKQIWAEMKGICHAAGIAPTKVFPHNLRHLFARVFYKACKDIVRLADVLGHSNVETTRIYLISSGEDYARDIERLGLI